MTRIAWAVVTTTRVVATATPGQQVVARARRMVLFDCRAVPVTRYRYRGAAILSPWSRLTTTEVA